MDRIRIACAQSGGTESPFFFPFTQGLCSCLNQDETEKLSTFSCTIHGLTLRVALPSDAKKLVLLLDSYGNSSGNYEDLEIFQTAKLPTIIRNMCTCLTHRYFIVFFLCMNDLPVAFFQVDPYRIQTLSDIFEKKLFDQWNIFFKKPLAFSELTDLHQNQRMVFLTENFISEKFHARFPEVDGDFLQYVCESLETYVYFRQELAGNRNGWLGNISYAILPEFQHLGLMTALIEQVELWLKCTHGAYLFSDRIAQGNQRSIALLTKQGFKPTGSFMSVYGADYKTRAHPCGNFVERCVGFFKELA